MSISKKEMTISMNSLQGRLKKFSFGIFVCFLVLVGMLIVPPVVSEARAGDVWEKKQYKNWTLDDIRTIKTNSPWTKKVIKNAPWIKGAGGYLSILPVGCDGRPDYSRHDTPTPQVVSGLTPRVEYRVDWVSSRTMRYAEIQENVLCGKLDEESAEGLLDEEVDYFQIAVKSPDMKPFEDMDDEEIRTNAWLNFKNANKKINPYEVRIQRLPGQKRILTMVFMFPKEDENGESYLSEREKEIEFVVDAEKFDVKAKFKPSKMIGNEGPDM